MNTAKLRKTLLPALALTLLLGACGGNNGADSAAANGDAANDNASSSVPVSSLPVLTASPYVLSADEEGVEEFAALNASYEPTYANDAPHNITPDFIREEGSYSVFKYEKSNETFVVYDGAVYAVGSGFGGDGVTSMALADVNGDEAYELYYGFSDDGSSFVGCFDPAGKKARNLSGGFSGQAIVLTADGNTLAAAAAEADYESMLSMTLTAGDTLGRIGFEDGAITFTRADA